MVIKKIMVKEDKSSFPPSLAEALAEAEEEACLFALINKSSVYEK